MTADLPPLPPEDDEDDSLPDVDNAITVEVGDGSVDITFGGDPEDEEQPEEPDDFDDNLAETIDSEELTRIAGELMDGIKADDDSRQQWLQQRQDALEWLGLSPKKNADSDTATIVHPMLLEAVLRFQANASAEMLPADGPAKIRDDTIQQPPMDGSAPQPPSSPPQISVDNSDDLADALETEINHYLTTKASEFYPDTKKMLFGLGFGGTAFKKVYHCPIRNRPVSESVDAEDLIVSNDAVDLQNAGRVTQKIKMRHATLRRMQLIGAYRDVELPSVEGEPPDAPDDKKDEIQGVDKTTIRPEDRERVIYECYCELDIKGHEHKDKDGPTGLALPYKVTVDKSSSEILEVRRNWERSDDDALLPVPNRTFVKYSFVPTHLGFYDIGLLHILGNSTRAATAAWRIMIDAGMREVFPGGFVKKLGTHNNTISFKGAPGQFIPVDSGAMALSDAIMAYPFKGPNPVLISLVQDVVQTAERVGGTAETNVGEGRADAPVGTTLALLEQQKVILDAVHKGLHASQAEEFQLLVQKWRENPESLFKGNRRPAAPWTVELVLKALNDNDVVPVSDPNTSSHLQRLAVWQALEQMVEKVPGFFDIGEVIKRGLKLMRVPNPQQILSPNPTMQAPPDPAKMADIQLKQQIAQLQATMKGQELKLKQAELQIKQGEAASKHIGIVGGLQNDAQRNQIDAAAGQQGGPAPEPQDPVAIYEAQTRRMDAETRMKALQVKHADTLIDNENQAADRQSENAIAALNFHKELAMHGASLDDNQAGREADLEAAKLAAKQRTSE